MMPSLRTRLTVAIVVVTGPVVAALVVLLYLAASTAIWEAFDRETRDTAEIFANLVEWDREDGYEIEGGAPIAGVLAREPSPAHVLVRAPSGPLLEDPVIAGLPEMEPGRAVEMTTPGGRELRGLRILAPPRLDDGGAPPDGMIEVTVLRETDTARETLATVATWFWLLGAGTVLLSTAVVGLAVQRGMAPVHALARELDTIDGPDDALGVSVGDVPSELRPIVRKLEALLGRLREAFERERRFTADVSHELRTPLSVVRTSLDVALQGERAPTDYQGRLAEIRESLDRMSSMVERLLLLSRADAGRLPVHPGTIPLAPLVEECWAPFAAAAARRNATFQNHLAAETSLEADEDLLRMIVTNLLSNAAEYTDPGGWIRVTSGQDPVQVLAVTSSGPPLPSEQLQRVFEPFWRGDEARSDAGVHCGIGLALARALARCQGLEVTLANRADGAVVAAIETQRPGDAVVS